MARAGLAGEALAAAIAVLDSHGLLVDDGSFDEAFKHELAWTPAVAARVGLGARASLQQVIEKLAPTVLIGTTGQANTFDETMVRAMAARTERPIVFPLSNPTAKAEAQPRDLMRWTDGRALVATGSPFEPVVHEGRTHRIAQCNNVYIFPGVGLGAVVAHARRVTDSMFTVAADSLAATVDSDDLAAGALFPRLSELRAVTRAIARDVALEAVRAGVAEPIDAATVEARIDATMWQPRYVELRPV
jgi:malic enzyme